MLLVCKVSEGKGFHGSWHIAGDIFHFSTSFLQTFMQDDLLYIQKAYGIYLNVIYEIVCFSGISALLYSRNIK